MSILELRHISKQFGGVTALSDLSMDLAEGSIHGVIGPNGAGKTTLISIISGFVQTGQRPDTVERAGHLQASGVQTGTPRHCPYISDSPGHSQH